MKSFALACLGLIVAACSSSSTNEGAGGSSGGGSSGSGATGGGGSGGSGGATGGTGATGGATGGSAGATGGSAGATGGAAGATGGAAGATTGGTGGSTGGTGGTGGTTVTCPANDCVAAWYFVETSATSYESRRGEIKFGSDGKLTQTYETSSASSGSCSNCTFSTSGNAITLNLPGVASGVVASTNDVIVATYHDEARQIVMVKKGSGMSNAPVQNGTYRLFGFNANPTVTQHYGLSGSLKFDGAACLPKVNNDPTSRGHRADAAGTQIEIFFWGDGAGTEGGCLAVATNGEATLDHLQTSTAAAKYNGVFKGHMAPGGHVILLTPNTNTGVFTAGTILLVRQPESGMSKTSVQAQYHVSQLRGGAAAELAAYRGSVSFTAAGVTGSLTKNGASVATSIVASPYEVNPTGAIWVSAPAPLDQMVGQVRPAASLIATYKVKTTNPAFTDPVGAPSLMLWVK